MWMWRVELRVFWYPLLERSFVPLGYPLCYNNTLYSSSVLYSLSYTDLTVSSLL